ncbi:ATP-binding protein [Cellulomonas sp. APG4]|uniref:AAA family ATPase n=1 Tax=Cellulomonas sp. APG4 TaxID=1538656 RepID=UPI00137B84F4|nr:ATP-binding protein [Cellulomonas sp. APG4]NCT91870.1 ATP-binding protein [Cellulomonas sp. APG4]
MTGPAGTTVHLLAGLNGAGKTTHARRLEAEGPAVRFTLDEWMLRLHGLSYEDPRYPELSERCRRLIWDVALQVLATGTDVVLDWNLWSRDRRERWRDEALSAGYRPVLHHVAVPLETALGRAEHRRCAGDETSHALTAEGVRHLARLFEPPTADEGLEIRVVSPSAQV